MGWQRGYGYRSLLGAFVACCLVAGTARAQVSTERSVSIVIFPKLLYGDFDSGSFDTFIQMSNTSNSVVYAHCFYVNAALTDPTAPEGPGNPRLWQEVDFDLVLTKQQPTHWIISEGRVTNPFDPSCSPTNLECNDAGFDPGRIPPVPPGFEGELKCIEVDQSGAPISGNHLKGEATLITTGDDATVLGFSGGNKGDVSKYNAIGIRGLDTNDSNTVLCLGGGASGACPAGAEYEGCPDAIWMSHFAEGAKSPAFEGTPTEGSVVGTQLTIVPCAQDYETQIPALLRVQFAIFNEFEEPFSTSTTVECWGNFSLTDINPVFEVGSLGSRFAHTRMRPAGTDPSFVAVLEEFHRDSVRSEIGRAAVNLTVVGERGQTDLIVIPEGP